MVGETLGHYEILEPLGAGGMGQVYRARDRRLEREVAIKVLGGDPAGDTESLARFEREAQLLAALNHPNIASIYGLEESAGVRFIAMELVEGETLERRLKRGPPGVEEALRIAAQIAAGLEAAHAEGIVHRDVKPANIVLAKVGGAKLLDFGVAKAFEDRTPRARTVAATELTMAGTAIGTAPYMSPEQVRGEEIDKRADVWGFACVVYEMLAAKPAFGRETMGDTLAAVLEHEPEWGALPAECPGDVRRLLARCLRKDRSRRLRDLGDARLEIEDALTGSAAEPTTTSMLFGPATRGEGTSRPTAPARPPTLVPALALLAGFVLGGAAIRALLWPEPPSAPPPARFELGFDIATRGSGLEFALSPDGRTLVYVAAGTNQLFVRELDQIEARAIPGTEAAQTPFFSPDGQWLGFWSDGALRKAPVGGGPVTEIARTSLPYGVTWSLDNRILLGPLLSGLVQVSAAGGVPEPFAERDPSSGAYGHELPRMLPGDSAAVFQVVMGGLTRQIALASLETGEWRLIGVDGLSPQYIPTGHILFARPDGSLWALPFDLDRLEVTGEPFLAIDERVTTRTNRGLFDVGADGTLVFQPSAESRRGRLVWVDRVGGSTPLPFEERLYLHPRLSPDGRRVATTIRDPVSGDEHVWILDLDRGTDERLTVEGANRWPVWMDDDRVIFTSTRGDSYLGLFSKVVDGSGAAEPMLPGDVTLPISWSADHETLAYYVIEAFGDIWTLPKGGSPREFLATQFDERSPVFSPDGRWLAYVSNESGRDEIYVRPYPGPGGRETISTDGGIEPAWSRDGGELYYRNGSLMMVVEVAAGGDDLHPSPPEVLFEEPFGYSVIGRGNANYDVAADGRFLMFQGAAGGESGRLRIVLNWFEELKRRAPANR